jgi:hypothetical protein
MRVAIALSLDMDGQIQATLSTSLGHAIHRSRHFLFFVAGAAPLDGPCARM